MRIIRGLIKHIFHTWSYTKRTLWALRGVLWWLLKTKGWRAFYNYLFVKLFVRVGEGGCGVFYQWLNPLLYLFPTLPARFAPYPFDVEIEITNRCNKRCVFCEHTYWTEPSRDLTFPEFERIISQFPNLKWVNLTGEGDPFLNKDFLRMIEYLKKRDVLVYFVESFDLLTPEISEKLVTWGVDGIFMSMDGATKETYERLKVGCNFERSLHNLKELIRIKQEKRSPLPEISFRYVVNKINTQEVVPFIELVHSLGGKKLLGPTTDIEFAGVLKFKENDFFYIPEIPAEVEAQAMKRARELDLNIHFAHASKLPNIRFCNGWLQPYIMMGGYVMPCCGVLQTNNRDHLRKLALGNIFTQDFKDIWYSQRYASLRMTVPTDDKNVPIPPICRGCRGVDPGERR